MNIQVKIEQAKRQFCILQVKIIARRVIFLQVLVNFARSLWFADINNQFQASKNAYNFIAKMAYTFMPLIDELWRLWIHFSNFLEPIFIAPVNFVSFIKRIRIQLLI